MFFIGEMMNKKGMKTLRRRFVTLIEMMIVMFLIALITGVVAYNYRGSLEEGKAFKTKAGMEKLETILNLAAADNPDIDFSGPGWQDFIKNSPLVKDADSLIKDGWGNTYTVNYDESNRQISITSEAYNSYRSKNKASMFK
jgi:general secretion pathway protein G